jgi:hypothetical protein
MMKKGLLLCAIALLLGFSSDAFAQRRYRTNDRTDRQRVQRGIRSGQITRAEAQQIRERERQIRAIRRNEREQDRYIRSQRHDDERRNRMRRGTDRRRGDGYYRRGAGSPTHPVFGSNNRRGRGRRGN